MHFNGQVIPFAAMVEYLPISAKGRLHQFGAKVLPGLFLGYALYAGGTRKGDIMVADVEELVEMDAQRPRVPGTRRRTRNFSRNVR